MFQVLWGDGTESACDVSFSVLNTRTNDAEANIEDLSIVERKSVFLPRPGLSPSCGGLMDKSRYTHKFVCPVSPFVLCPCCF